MPVMCSLKSLATEIMIQVIDSIDDTPSVSRLSRTSRHLHCVANTILYRRAIEDPTALAWAVSHDRPDVVHGILGHQADPHRFAASFELNILLHQALVRASFKTANALLDVGADVVYSSDSRRRSSCQKTIGWLANGTCPLLGSLALAASSRFHIGFWYDPNCGYSSERQFWDWKKMAMEKILKKLAAPVFRDQSVVANEPDRTEYQRELDYALIEAAKADAHSSEVMEFLLEAGADINSEVNSQIVGQAWYNALDEEVPSLFRSKVEFLIQHGVDRTRVWSPLEGLQTSLQFILTKLHRCCRYTTDGSLSIPKALYFMDFLASRGCLRWPKVTDMSMDHHGNNHLSIANFDENEAGAQELNVIFSDTDVSIRPLQRALCQHILQQVLPLAERRMAPLQLPLAVMRLDDLYEAWVCGSNDSA
ncbi:hypothetical protein BDP55DRAFT_636633 [Colletotrichum godetiae]|uniref:Uncharacterized protein n=1 Tax=Colletotrichum godetiae TaxID=1209918 RepID=A0AAJ0AB04_9PEZI|nr:uncharacterized protein BDP55DRAFT_636633 [Colletotrichum godetiae]KAK1659802.1 hypothetical protein BDP55DRAFT_636633 [Colletotrichum godetiae]